MRGPFGGGVHTSRICCCCSGSRSIARSPSCCCYSPPHSCCCFAPIKPHFSRLNRLLGQSIFRGWGGSPELRRTTRSGNGGSPERYPTIYLRVQGGGGRPRGLAGAAVASCFGVARWRWGWRLRGCRLKMNCRPSLNYMSSASLLPLRSVSTVAFRFHSKFQFRQLSSESTVFTSSVVVRWFLVM